MLADDPELAVSPVLGAAVAALGKASVASDFMEAVVTRIVGGSAESPAAHRGAITGRPATASRRRCSQPWSRGRAPCVPRARPVRRLGGDRAGGLVGVRRSVPTSSRRIGGTAA
ncbi:MAG: hypothetical protein R2734_12635 [Nocardioides sp.]